MNKPLLHMQMSEKRGNVMTGTYSAYLEGDIERSDDFISLHSPEIGGELITSVMSYAITWWMSISS